MKKKVSERARLRAMRERAYSKGVRESSAYWEGEVSDAQRALNRYYAGYGKSQRRVAELESIVAALSPPNTPLTFDSASTWDITEAPSMWEIACAFAPDLNQHPQETHERYPH